MVFEFRDVFTRSDRRMLASFDCILLRRETERVPTHGMQDVEATQTFVARDDVGGSVPFRMAHVQPRPTRVRKHIEHEELWLLTIEAFLAGIGRVKKLAFVPDRLPLGLDLVEWIRSAALATH